MQKYKIEPLANGEWALKEFINYDYISVSLATYKTAEEAKQAARNLSRKAEYIEIGD